MFDFFNLIFPQKCTVCNKEGFFICPECQKKISKPMGFCCVCKKPSYFGKTHEQCKQKNKYCLDGFVSVFYYDFYTRKIISLLKFNYVTKSTAEIANLVAESIKTNPAFAIVKNDYVFIPVPLHNRRLNWRGFNQSEMLLSAISKIFNLKTSFNIVKRVSYKCPQSKLIKKERVANVKNVFKLEGSVDGGKFVIFDDIFTTGSTLMEISKLLKKNGAKEVWGMAVCVGH